MLGCLAKWQGKGRPIAPGRANPRDRGYRAVVVEEICTPTPRKAAFCKLRPGRVASGGGMIHGVTEALVVLRQRFVDMSCRYCGVTGSDCNLVEI